MKKTSIIALAAAVTLMGSVPAFAEKGSAGGLELSGHVDTLFGWQHDGKDYNLLPGQANNGINSVDSSGGIGLGTQGVGQLGDFRGFTSGSRDTFNFYLDEVEVDINKTFGENVRVRADLDFGRGLSGSPNGNFALEQAYVTANIPVGNGVEFLVGRFNAPIGLESVDRIDNTALSFSNVYRFVRPQNVTGAKIYYQWSDNIDWHLYAVNNLWDSISGDTPIPSYGTRLGFNWGEEGKENTVGISYAGGPEGVVRGVNRMKHFTHIGDIDFSLHATDALVIAGEAIYRQDNQGGACFNTADTNNCKALAGNLAVAYDFTESWNGWLRYDYLHDIQGNYTAIDQQIHAGSIGAGYKITDGAKMKMEYRIDLGIPSEAATGSDDKTVSHGFAVDFAYNF